MNTNASQREVLRRYAHLAAMLTLFAFVLRIICAFGYENEFDTEWNLMWANDLQNGFFNAYTHVRQLDYPPLYLWVLKIVGAVVADPAVGGNTAMRMLCIKFFPVLFDTATALLLFRIGSRRSATLGLIGCALWCLNPAPIYNCAFWGQTDCVMIFFLLLTFMLLTENRLKLAGAAFGLCMLLKLQCAYLAPVVGLELLCRARDEDSGPLRGLRLHELTRALAALGVAVGVWIVGWLPFMIGAKSVTLPFDIMLGGLGTYPHVTLNADNIWGIFNLNWVEDTTSLLGSITYRVPGVLLTVFSFAACILLYFIPRRRSTWLCGAVMLECIFMLTTRQHERYQICLLIFLLCFYLENVQPRWLNIYTLQSAVVLFNMARVLESINHNGPWCASANTMQTINSLVNLALFGFMAYYTYLYAAEKRPPSLGQLLPGIGLWRERPENEWSDIGHN